MKELKRFRDNGIALTLSLEYDGTVRTEIFIRKTKHWASEVHENLDDALAWLEQKSSIPAQRHYVEPKRGPGRPRKTPEGSGQPETARTDQTALTER